MKIQSRFIFVLILLTAMTVSAFAQNTSDVIVLNDFRVNVKTNRSVYNHRDVLHLTIELLNDSPNKLHISRINEEIETDSDEGLVFDGVLDGENVDVVIDSSMPIVIGYATLIPIDPKIMTFDDSGFAPIPEKKIRLPLFGSTVIPAHSTRILSRANILIGYPVYYEPDPATDSEKPDNSEREQVSAVRRITPMFPGDYLLECNITRLHGVDLAQAQKVIRIIKKKPSPDLLQENNRMLKKVLTFEEMHRKIASYVKLNTRYCQAILRYLIGRKPDPEPEPDKPVIDNTQEQSRDQINTTAGTRLTSGTLLRTRRSE